MKTIETIAPCQSPPFHQSPVIRTVTITVYTILIVALCASCGEDDAPDESPSGDSTVVSPGEGGKADQFGDALSRLPDEIDYSVLNEWTQPDLVLRPERTLPDYNHRGTRQLDLLLVLDNSGSTCELQGALRENIRSSLAELTGSDIDVQIGVTTTQTQPDYALEPVAEPGKLQSTPQPLPGFDPKCNAGVDGDFAPIRESVETAVRCAGADPSNYQWTDADIDCALYGNGDCSIEGVCEGRDCTAEVLFPAPSEYREIPKVLAVREYVDSSGKIRFDELVADFECMSLVGNRGYGIEKGLEAAVMAVSPELTGGAVGSENADSSAPNHGLIRKDSEFGLLFLTDENDCSHDGSLAEDSACGGDVCEFANIAGEDSPLIEPSLFADQLVSNLQQTKGDDAFSRSRVRVASIHGRWGRFEGPALTGPQCGASTYMGVQGTCNPLEGDARLAYSGDRYERFLDAFADGSTYPPRMSEGDHRLGAACMSELGGVFIDAMSVIAR